MILSENLRNLLKENPNKGLFEDRGGSLHSGFENFKHKVVKNPEKWQARLLNIESLWKIKECFQKMNFFLVQVYWKKHFCELVGRLKGHQINNQICLKLWHKMIFTRITHGLGCSTISVCSVLFLPIIHHRAMCSSVHNQFYIWFINTRAKWYGAYSKPQNTVRLWNLM